MPPSVNKNLTGNDCINSAPALASDDGVGGGATPLCGAPLLYGSFIGSDVAPERTPCRPACARCRDDSGPGFVLPAIVSFESVGAESTEEFRYLGFVLRAFSIASVNLTNTFS